MIERLTQEQFDEVDFEISDAEIRRSAVHHRNVRGWPELGFEGADPTDMEAMLDRVFLGHMATDLFLNNPVARTATLGIIRLRGDWRRDASVQDSLIGPDARLRTEYESRVFSRHEQDNNLQYNIDAGVVSLKGVSMLTRQRRLLLTESFEHEFEHTSGRRVMARLAIAVSKLSTFAVDLDHLRKHPDAAREIYEIHLAGMVLRANKRRFQRIANVMGDFDYVEDQAEDIELAMPDINEERAAMADLSVIHEKMREYDVGADVVLSRVAAGNSLQARRPETIKAIEEAIINRNG
ncbi:MAG TPA: hypothetical protein VM581_01585, partial [Magnetospirillaceae bacterium]|nr:hypothetical protein [Magnetospirillaceae bacterium]